jgi:outer membrane lipoprotein-sorting protein
MKKLVFVMAFLVAATAINAQSLEEIVKKFSEANHYDKVGAMSTIKITAKMSMMGMDLPMEMWMKNPNKIKTVTSFNGQDMIQVFDGTKGYSVNPMTGSSDPVEMTPEQIKQTQNSNIFQNPLANYYKDGKLTLEGEETVNNKPAFKLKANLDGGNAVYLCIDKDTYLLAKTTTTVNQGGQEVTVESFPSDYKDNNGVLLPMKTTSSASGMEFVLVFDKVEVNIPIEDSVFKIK